MNLRQVEVFCAVVRCRTLVAASHELGVSQPAVSNAIKHLEAQLGIVLFERVSNRLVPTQEALSLYRDAEPLQAMGKALETRISDIRNLKRGNLRILATQALGRAFVARAAARFAKRGSGLYVYFDIRRMEGVVEAIETGFADLGFAIDPATRPGIAIEPLARGRMVVAIPRGHPLASLSSVGPEDLAGERVVGLEEPSRIGSSVRKVFEQKGVTYRCDVEVRHCTSACMLVEQGTGVAIVDEFSASPIAGWNIEIRPFTPEIALQACAMYVQARTPSRLARRFIAELRNLGPACANGSSTPQSVSRAGRRDPCLPRPRR